jgi:hypothetical protein
MNDLPEESWLVVERAELWLQPTGEPAALWAWSLDEEPFVSWREAVEALGERAPDALERRIRRALQEGDTPGARNHNDGAVAIYLFELLALDPARALSLAPVFSRHNLYWVGRTMGSLGLLQEKTPEQRASELGRRGDYGRFLVGALDRAGEGAHQLLLRRSEPDGALEAAAR